MSGSYKPIRTYSLSKILSYGWEVKLNKLVFQDTIAMVACIKELVFKCRANKESIQMDNVLKQNDCSSHPGSSGAAAQWRNVSTSLTH